MVSTAKSPNHHSPPSAPSPASQSGDGNSPKFPRKNLPSPWSQVVRGGEPEPTAGIHQSSPSSSSSSLATDQAPSTEVIGSHLPPGDNSNAVGVVDSSDGSEGNADRSKKPVWNKPSNGVVETGAVMGAESWPALSASPKRSAKLPESSTKTVHGVSLSTSQGPIMTSQSPQKQPATNAKPNSAPNHNVPSRHRPGKRIGGSGIVSGPSHSNFSNPPLPPPPPPFPVYQLPPVSYGSIVPGVPDHAPRDHYWNNNRDPRPMVGGFVPSMNEYRGSSRRGNFKPHARGDGSYHNGYGSRRDQDRGNHYVNTRDTFLPQPRMPPRGLLRHPSPNTAAFVGPQPIGPFANPMGYSEFYYYQPVAVEQFPGVPIFTHSPPPTPIFASENPLSSMIVNQIEYYFSDANLVQDDFLRSKMDEQGWVPVTLIADFPRVRKTTNIQLILDSLRISSALVEVEGDKLRRNNEWWRWVSSTPQRATSGSISPSRSVNKNLTANFQTITLEETTKDEGSSQFRNASNS